MYDLENEDNNLEYERPNKSKLRREALELQALVKDLVELHESEWEHFNFEQDVLKELHIYKDTIQHVAKKRQLKRVAKILRETDVSGAEFAVENAKKQHADVNAAFHKVEQWRDKLISGGREVLTDLLNEYPDLNAQELNQLVRNAKQEAAKNKGTKSSKLLFKLLRDVVRKA